MLTQVVTDCEQTEQRLEKKAVRSRQTSLDLDMLQARIKLLEDVVRAIANEREKLKIEIEPPRRGSPCSSPPMSRKEKTRRRA